MNRLLLLPLLTLLSTASAAGASRHADVGAWLEKDLVPYVQEQLSTHPRFRNQSFRFVVMSDDSPQSEGTALAIELRDRLRDGVGALPGIRVAWQADQPGVGLVAGNSSLDCTKNEADYFIGVELKESPAGLIEVNVRALDIEERSWVAGFAATWQGHPSAHQRRQLMQFASDPTFRGERNAPWDDSETDLMAAQLAYELGCKLLRQTAGEYVLAATGLNGDVDPTTALVELVTNNLAGTRALQFSTASDTSNAVIGGKAHRIDDDLFQYWVTITPTDSSTEMTALSADAYVRIPDRYKAATLVPEAQFDLPRSGVNTLSAFSVVRMQDQRACLATRDLSSMTASGRRYAFGGSDCFALAVDVADDAVVFFLNHQRNAGLVRLSGNECANRNLAKVARSDRNLHFPLPLDSLQSGEWTLSNTWSLDPPADSYYVIAATDTKAARALSKHIEKLPKRCSASLRGGLEDEALRIWLEELDAIRAHWATAIDWRSIRVKEVY